MFYGVVLEKLEAYSCILSFRVSLECFSSEIEFDANHQYNVLIWFSSSSPEAVAWKCLVKMEFLKIL